MDFCLTVDKTGMITAVWWDFLFWPEEGPGTQGRYSVFQENENPADYRFWWHSHPNFDVQFSPIDNANIERYSKKLPFYALCLNQFGEMNARMDEKGRSIKLPIIILPYDNKELKKECIKKAKLLVKKEIIKMPNTFNLGGRICNLQDNQELLTSEKLLMYL